MGIDACWGRRRAAGDRYPRLHRQARGWRISACAVRDLDRQDAGLPRAGIPGRRTDARSVGDPSPVRLTEPVDAREPELRHRPSARRLAGAGELPRALPRPSLCAAQHVCAPRLGIGALGGVAGSYPGRTASVRDRGDRARVQGNRYSGRAASDHRSPGHPSRNRKGSRRRAGAVAGNGLGRPVDGGDDEGDGRRRPARARRSRLRALGGVARPADDGDTAQRCEPGHRLHVARERPRARRDRRQGHAAGRRDQRRVFDSHRFHCHRHFLVPHSRTLRHRGRPGARSLPRRAAMTVFEPAAAVLGIPAVAAGLLVVLPGYRLTAALNVTATFLTFLAAVSLFFGRPTPGPYLLVDDLNNVFIVLTTFVGFTTSVFSASYIAHEIETGRLTTTFVRFYHAMYQVLMFAMNLALVANNIGVMWVAIELATLTTVLMVGIYRTHEALEAAWKYFILGSVGIALALCGTILVYMAARPIIGEGSDAMVWTMLIKHAAQFDPALLNVAFVFLLLGYGTKVGLAPLHAWLPDAHAEGPTPISAVLSGLLLNVALYAVLRFKMLLAVNPGALAPGPLMVTMGLISLVFAAFMLYRRRDIKRLFAYSSIEHMGIITFAFGMGGPLEFCRPPAHDHAFADQVGDLLCGRPHR